jgi:hypothetical protein
MLKVKFLMEHKWLFGAFYFALLVERYGKLYLQNVILDI